MFENYDFIIRSGTLITHMGRVQADIGVSGGKIAAIGDLSASVSDRVFDASNLTVLPGVIDTQASFQEPGFEYKEDLESGSRSAILGGITTVFDLPETRPLTLTAEHVKAKVSAAKNRLWCDYGFYISVTAQTLKTLGWMEKTQGVCGANLNLAVDTNHHSALSDDTLLALMKHGVRRVTIRPEDGATLAARAHLSVKGDPASHGGWRSPDVGVAGINKALDAARKAGRKIHFQSISSADELALLARHKDIATLDVNLNNLLLTLEGEGQALGNLSIVNPPLRDARHRASLWAAISNGLVDCISSAHQPHNAAEKNRPYPDTPSGMPGVQTMLPLLLDAADKGELSLERLIDLLSTGPARIYNLRDKGHIAVGYDADFALVDLKAEWVIEASKLASKAGWSPYEGRKVKGQVKASIVRGRVVMRDGEVVGNAQGKVVRFLDNIKPDYRDYS